MKKILPLVLFLFFHLQISAQIIQLDTTFADSGKFILPSLNQSDVINGGISIGADGKIILAGTASAAAIYPRVICLLPSGEYDNSFGINGVWEPYDSKVMERYYLPVIA